MSVRRFKVFPVLSLMLILCNSANVFSQESQNILAEGLKADITNDVCSCLDKLGAISSIEEMKECFRESITKYEDQIDIPIDLKLQYPELMQEILGAEKVATEVQLQLIQKCDSYYLSWLNILSEMHKDIRLFASQESLESISLLLDGSYSSEGLSKRGTIYMGLNKLDSALNDFNEALRLNPDNIQAAYFSGWVYELKKDYEKANKVYGKIINQTSDPEATLILEVLKRRLREMKK